ncbi:hypothetical protein [Pyrococcus yayanosii]|uniref:Uncharacterized protein n=1 Tax=Pyrococcus yayanosii (strain CH1 / JCM 16557) TaxID=529709 RepID=F8AFY9_PYRYC|nr:hypothetical protein [Pyrococcus yayanosii]AEH25043.1 hypothetical protein PYCH_13730 [Pyrococcus yayanosii CH1]
MRIYSNVPGERRSLLMIVRAYMLYLYVATLLAALFTVLNLYWARPKQTLSYLLGTFFFLTSSIMYRDFLSSLKRTRFPVYWRLFRMYSPPLGAYALGHVLIGLVLLVADMLKGGYFFLGLLIITKGLFEHLLSREMVSLSLISLLYDEVSSGRIDMLVLKNPFR